ncbi:MAG: ATPase component of transporter with duplicated ATPase protein [Candidatus Saccharibacteria bacterium]|nr:ATPase component of transporter with duplicated ATPase protein [Candidatus Saccharibacteria bacterium]
MLLSVNVTEKSFGNKVLYDDLRFDVQNGEKVGLIGRNGTGKSTLFSLITGADKDFQGEIEVNRRAVIISSRQEHHGLDDTTVLDYIQGDLPEYSELAHIIETYPAHMAEDERRMQRFSEALERFSQLGYYQLEDEIKQLFEAYQLPTELMHAPMKSLSGGQKRMVELIKVQRAKADLALIDEPTNHMDYVAKDAFIKWLSATQEGVLVITHDRDVLRTVDRIIEIRDGRAFTFRGNYEHFLKTNTSQITGQVNEYDLTQRRIGNLRNDVIRFRRLKEKSRDPGTIKRFKGQEERAVAELAKLEKAERPSFWIDQQSVGDLSEKMTDAYQKYKARNIRITTRKAASRSSRLLVQATNVSLGYDHPLFADVNFSLHEGEHVRLHGRNGAGKTTLVRAIMSKVTNTPSVSTSFEGHLITENDVSLGLYEQEIDESYLSMTLHEAVEHVLAASNQAVSDQKVKQLLGDYLFNPSEDGAMQVERLSGGQKSRFQLIKMLANDPDILILDEPTNHLDLPSIEELENALQAYSGAVLYISHDSYFASKLAGETVPIGS